MTIEYGLTGIGSNVQFGKAGPRITQSGGAFSIRNAADSAYVNMFILDPTLAQHAATKAYVDSVGQGLDIKASVVYASVAALPASTYANGSAGLGATITETGNGALLLDGFNPTAGMRVLIKDQANPIQNGIYDVTDAGSGGSPFILTRSSDSDNSPAAELTGGAFCFVTAGSSLADTGWVISTPDGLIAIGTDNIVFTQFSAAGVITVGAGGALDKTGNTLSVRVDGVTIGINGVGNGQLIVRSTALQGQVPISSGVAGDVAAWGYVENLRGETTGRLIIDGIDAGGADTNYLAVTTSNAGAPGTVTLAATSATTTNVDLVLNAKGTGLIVVSDAISTLSNANLILQPNGTGLVAVSAEITSVSNANLILNPNGTGLLEVGATVTTTSGADLVLDPNGAGLIAVGAEVTSLSNANLIFNPNGTGLVEVGAAITTTSNANLILDPNGTGIIVAESNIDVKSNTIQTSTANGDIFILPNGTGVISVTGTTNYENNVTDDDDIPNKKYVDNAVTAASPSNAVRSSISADSANSSFNIGTTLPDVIGKNTYVNRITLNVTTPFTGGSVTQARVTDGTNICMLFSENDISIANAYIADLSFAFGSDGAQLSIEFYQADGTTLAIPTAGAVIATGMFSLV